jgi:hypothetical protein
MNIVDPCREQQDVCNNTTPTKVSVFFTTG